MIDLYTAGTPNGWKASITLEELELPYEVHAINLGAGDQKQPDYLKINPNGRIPTIVDRDEMATLRSSSPERDPAGTWRRNTDRFLMPMDAEGTVPETLQWLMFQMGGVGPMQGQANVFFRYFEEKIPSAISRYQNETKRLYTVLDTRLADNEFLAGDYSIADIANWSWVRIHGWSGVDIDDLPHLVRWKDQLAARPAVQRGCEVPKPPEVDEETLKKEMEKGGRSILQR